MEFTDSSKIFSLATENQFSIVTDIKIWIFSFTDNCLVISQSKKQLNSTKFLDNQTTSGSLRDGKNQLQSLDGDIFNWEFTGCSVQESLYTLWQSRDTIFSGLLLVMFPSGLISSTTGQDNQTKKSKMPTDTFWKRELPLALLRPIKPDSTKISLKLRNSNNCKHF